jgi:hypothetical protein
VLAAEEPSYRALLNELRQLLHGRFNIHHTTLQIEAAEAEEVEKPARRAPCVFEGDERCCPESDRVR